MSNLAELLKAPDATSSLVEGAIGVQRLDYELDLLRLVGQVIALRTLLDVASSPTAEESARVSAARALTQITKNEDPEKTAERLRAAPFADFNHDELQLLIDYANEGMSLKEAVERIKQERE